MMRWLRSHTVRAVAVAAVVMLILLGYLDLFTALTSRDLGNVSLTAMAVLVTAFTGLYCIRSRWWSNRIGKVFLIKSTLLSLVMIQISVSSWTGSAYPGRDAVRLIIYVGGALAFVALLVTLWQEQQRDREGPR